MLLLPPGCVWPTFISPWSLKQGVDKGEAAVQPWRRTMLIQCTVVQHLGHRREDQGLRDSRSGVFPPIPAVSHSLEQLSDKTVCQLCERQLLRVRSGSAQAWGHFSWKQRSPASCLCFGTFTFRKKALSPFFWGLTEREQAKGSAVNLRDKSQSWVESSGRCVTNHDRGLPLWKASRTSRQHSKIDLASITI